MNHPHPSRQAALRRLAAAVLCAGAGLAQAQIAATPYGQTVLDFGRASGGAQATSFISPPATLPAGFGTVNIPSPALTWLTTAPNQANAGWWPATGGDHSTQGQTPHDGYFLLLNPNSNQSGQNIYTNTLTGLTVGDQYEFSFWAADVVGSNPAQLRYLLEDGGGAPVINQAFTVTTMTTPANLPWTQHVHTFTATSSTYTFHIQETRNNTASGNDFGLDDITLRHLATPPPVAVPVDSPWALGALALGILGVTIRRRRRAAGR